MIRKLFGTSKKARSSSSRPQASPPNHAERENRQKIEIVTSTSEPQSASPRNLEKAKKGKGSGASSSPKRSEKPKINKKQGDKRPPKRHRDTMRTENATGKPTDRTTKHHKSEPLPLPEMVPPPPVDGKTRFTDFDLAPEVLAACQSAGFEYCTPIQAKALPTTLKGLDLTGKAQTGTGKTAAFLLSAINHMLSHPLESRQPGACRMLVLAPTRELAIQIHKDAEALSKYTRLQNHVVYGGMDHFKQRDRLKYPVDILVGTPGRIIDYSRSGDLKLGKAEILVIDEADRMLDMGFIPDVRRIVSKLPPTEKRQTMFFSATFDQKILRLVSSWLKDPVTVESEPEHLVSGLIDQTFFAVTTNEKLPILKWILANDNVSRMLVFVNRKDMALRLSRKLDQAGFRCGLLSGDVPQRKRIQILERFRKADLKVIVATDVAARGIHVDDVSHVINYDLPYEPGDYVHRVGRTGRAGNAGKSISFLCERGSFVMPDIEELLGHEIKCVQPPQEMLGR